MDGMDFAPPQARAANLVTLATMPGLFIVLGICVCFLALLVFAAVAVVFFAATRGPRDPR